MRLLLVRHGQAVDGGGPIGDDARWLTRQGRAITAQVGAALRREGVTLARVLTSPRVRAVQTAEIMAAALGFAGEIEVLPALSFTVPAAQAVSELRQLKGGLTAAFGHMPTLAEIAAGLTGDSKAPAFAPSEALLIESGRARWRVTPDGKLVHQS